MASPSLTKLRDHFVAQVRLTAGGLPSSYWLLWTGTLVNRLGAFVMPFLALYLTRERGFSVEQAGFVAALHGAGVVVSGRCWEEPWRTASGGAPRCSLGLWLGSVAMVFLGFSRDLFWIRVAAFTLGVLGDLYRPAVFAAVSDVVRPEDRTRAFGLLYWVVNVGFAIALPAGGAAGQGGLPHPLPGGRAHHLHLRLHRLAQAPRDAHSARHLPLRGCPRWPPSRTRSS